MAESPKVCCIVLTWNGRELVLACLASLTKSNYQNLEIVVSDNGSTDGSIEAIREQYPDVILLENGANLRWAGGNNVGLRYGLTHDADYILLLNNDIEVDADMVTRLVETAERDRSIGILAPKIYYHAQPDLIWYAGGRVSWWRGLIWHIGIRKTDRGQYDDVSKIDYITGCAMMIRREVAEEVGEIDPAFIAYGEDVDYSMRASQAGWRMALAPRAIMWHKVSAYWGVASWGKIRQKLRSQVILYRRYAPVWAWFTTIPLFMVIDSLRVLILLAGGRITGPARSR